jgi:hypothetical protein
VGPKQGSSPKSKKISQVLLSIEALISTNCLRRRRFGEPFLPKAALG